MIFVILTIFFSFFFHKIIIDFIDETKLQS